ncbi:MAG: Gfo/Idh/MocA family oxidoreductase [Parvibaculaceae bacterium]
MHKVALIGAGRMGQCHAAHLAAHPSLDLAYIVERDTAAANAIVQAYGAATVSFAEMLADPTVEGVVICSSTDQHLSQTTEALSVGKAVFCEKPIGLELAEVIAATPDEGAPPFLLGLNRRFDPNIRQLANRLHSGEIGKVESLRIVNHDPASPKASFVSRSGGIFKDFTLHDLDLATWLLGEPIVEVFAAGSRLIDSTYADYDDFDTVRTILKTQSGALCCISNTRRSGCGYDQRLEAFGSHGRLSTDNLHTSNIGIRQSDGDHRLPIFPDFMSRYEESYRAESDHFAKILSGEEAPKVTYQDGIHALRLAEACVQSARTNQQIKISQDK